MADEQQHRPGRGWGAALTVLGVLALAVLLYGLAILVAPTENPGGQCSGIGWGCTLTPHDSLVFLGVIIGLPALVSALVLSSIAAGVLVRRTGLPGVLIGLISVVPALVVSAVLVTTVVFLAF
ncbi:hypothetical protein [Brachybacterium phenoliresistens]|uniref:hypothetical protein n=1 Tax=Brachybacterium phenoliresistens TaxID=396014 RepID=UPI0031D609B9